jgi:hypothetical protein
MLRLPQSIARSLSIHVPSSIRVSSIVILLAFVTLSSLDARAVTEQLTCTPSGLNFGDVTVDRAETQLVILKNSGHSPVTVSAMKLSGREFSATHLTLPLHLSAGASVTLTLRFAPTSTGWTGGRLTFTSNAKNSTLQLGLQGEGVKSEALKANPSSISFGQVALGNSSKLPLVLTNERSWAIKLVAFSSSSEGNGFSVSGPSLPLLLKAGKSVRFEVKFAPRATGLVGGSIFVSGPGIDIPLEGTGTRVIADQLHIAPEPLNFGQVPVGTTDTQIITIGATGASVTVSSATSSNSQFALEGASFPLTIAAGKSESFHVAFKPRNSGAISGALTLASNATNTPTPESLAGTGTVTPYTVSLSWNASTSDVAGYNVYRSAAASGPYGKINKNLDANTAYQDSTVVSGNTYYYAATSVDSNGKESALSTPAEAVVP